MKQIPDLIVVEDIGKGAMDTFMRSMQATNEARVHLEDDVILTSNFKEKIELEIEKRPNEVIQFFSMRKADLTE